MNPTPKQTDSTPKFHAKTVLARDLKFHAKTYANVDASSCDGINNNINAGGNVAVYDGTSTGIAVAGTGQQDIMNNNNNNSNSNIAKEEVQTQQKGVTTGTTTTATPICDGVKEKESNQRVADTADDVLLKESNITLYNFGLSNVSLLVKLLLTLGAVAEDELAEKLDIDIDALRLWLMGKASSNDTTEAVICKWLASYVDQMKYGGASLDPKYVGSGAIRAALYGDAHHGDQRTVEEIINPYIDAVFKMPRQARNSARSVRNSHQNTNDEKKSRLSSTSPRFY